MSEAVKGFASLFLEANGFFSWRKALTAIIGGLFAVAVLGFLFLDAPELPMSYQIIVSGVFTFYFLKDRMRANGTAPPTK